MRLIDANKLQKAIPAEEDNITGMGMTYDEMEAYNDGIDEQWKKIVNAPTVKAIPVEWIKGYVGSGVSDDIFQRNRRFVLNMIKDWEENNE